MGKHIPRFFVPALADDQAEALIEGAEARHARQVLRMQVGDRLIVVDGTGKHYLGRIKQLGKHCLRVTLEAPVVLQNESPLDLALAQGYLKDKKMDILVRHLTELGVRRWIPFLAERSVPAPNAQRIQARAVRWQKLSQEAVKQCRRSLPMCIEPLASFEAALKMADAYELKLIFCEQGGSCLFPESGCGSSPGKIFVMIGPEGGFEASEIEAARQHGFRAITVGPRVLRAETAALTACSVVQYVFGDMGENCP